MKEPLPPTSPVIHSPPRAAAGKFTYGSGDRPLEGYTIKRGIGQGGFGEVYYAISDGGKEVALKLVQRNLDVERRGVGQCLNLKHPNLVALYDVRQSDGGEYWVVMEYLAGPSLAEVIEQYPNGLPPREVRRWMEGLCAGLAYLHDRGIVHRDLKPGNIFMEEGVVKIGDYGLSKFISVSRRSGQTESVGTVHYMAPEIANGRYGKGIDIYAAGVILYEMLTGRVPFDGESVGEVLMKHLTAEPEVRVLPEHYRPIVSIALAKDPGKRFGTIQELYVEVSKPTGARRQNSEDRNPKPALEADIQPLACEVWLPPSTKGSDASPTATKPALPLPASKVEAVVKPRRVKLAELIRSMLLAVAVVLLVSGILATVVPFPSGSSTSEWWETSAGQSLFALVVLIGIVGTWAVLVAAKFWEDRRGDVWLRRGVMLVLGVAVGGLASVIDESLWIDWPGRFAILLPPSPRLVEPTIPLYAPNGQPTSLGYMAFFGMLFGLVRWWRLADPARRGRLTLGGILAPALAAWFIAMIWPFPHPWGVIWAAMIAMSVQLASPWRGLHPHRRGYHR